MSGKPYNGHKSWNHWNVALWINNDYGLYKVAREVFEKNPKMRAKQMAWRFLQKTGLEPTRVGRGWRYEYTPDGGRYTPSAVAEVFADYKYDHDHKED